MLNKQSWTENSSSNNNNLVNEKWDICQNGSLALVFNSTVQRITSVSYPSAHYRLDCRILRGNGEKSHRNVAFRTENRVRFGFYNRR